jgi:hypothetical protein
MFSGLQNTIPEEYRNVAEALFPAGGFTPEHSLSVELAIDFAEILGIGSDYRRLLDTGVSNAEQIARFLRHFQNNLDLLVQKTWVEKADETCKTKLQDEIPLFIAGIEQKHYEKALANFSLILDELAYLFFGPQAHKEDFTEYTFRIDTQMGLFWWYGGQIGRLRNSYTQTLDAKTLWAMLLLGLCYLTNF